MTSRNFSSFASATAGLALLAGLLPVQAADVQQLKAKPGPKPFNYVKAPGPLPNYVAGARWGTQAEPIQTMQEPLSPEASMARLVLPEGFSVSLFAAEPDIKKPVAMAWDERGRLWISETIDYPNEQQPNGEGRDRITICEDTNGDGKADKFTVFADKLSIPTTLAFVRGGLIVMEGGHVLFLKDTDGDDKADVREVLFSGWGMNDTHATASNFRYGFDNQIWGTVGYSGFNGTVGGQQKRFGQGVFRFTTKGDRLEFVRSSNNNTWGLGLSEDGTVFGSTANNNAAWYMAIPNRFYEGVSGWSASVMGTIADSQQIYPITDKVRQVDQHNKYTAGAGSALYTARSFPKEFWNRISFISEPTGHLTGFYELTGIGARDRADILMEILDPNRSVEANYRLWNVTTKDGETLSGRLDAETQTAVEILELSGTKHSIHRKDIASLESSPLSIMPTGFEQISESDLAALLEYLAQSNHPPGK